MLFDKYDTRGLNFFRTEYYGQTDPSHETEFLCMSIEIKYCDVLNSAKIWRVFPHP